MIHGRPYLNVELGAGDPQRVRDGAITTGELGCRAQVQLASALSGDGDVEP